MQDSSPFSPTAAGNAAPSPGDGRSSAGGRSRIRGFAPMLLAGALAVPVPGVGSPVAGPAPATGYNPSEWSAQQVSASDAAPWDKFGYAVANDGATTVAGAPGATINGNSYQGAAYILTLDTSGQWTEAQKVTANDGATTDRFGNAVALDSGTLFVGAPLADPGGSTDQGAVYVFSLQGGSWLPTQKLVAADGAAGTQFGTSLAVVGGNLLVGAPDSSAAAQGTVYVFSAAGGTWSQTAELTASDGAAGDGFGQTLGTDGTNRVIVGAPGATIGGNAGAGAAYIFTVSSGNWTQSAKLTGADCGFGDNFASGGVAIDGVTALVSTPYFNSQRGAAYFFAESGGAWSQSAEFTGGSGTGGHFGQTAALAGKWAVLGSNDDEALLFTSAGGHWALISSVSDPGNSANSYFGHALSFIGGNHLALVVGAPWNGPGNGSVYFETGSREFPIAYDGTLDVPTNTVTNGTLTASASSGLTFSIVEAPAHGDVMVPDPGAGGYTYTPDADYTGPDSFTFKVNNGVADSEAATISVTVSASANHPPTASDGSLSTNEDAAASGTLAASDPDGDPLTFAIVDLPAHGSVTLDDASSGAYTYTPDTGYSGADSFTFKANDGQVDSNVATVSVAVNSSTGGGSGGGSSGGGASGLPALAFLLGLAGLAGLRGRQRRQ